MIITAVFGDDWNALYLDEKLFWEGHSIPMWAWVDAINEAAGPEPVEAREWFADIDWLVSVGRYPKSLDDVLAEKE